jgi:hypothetical protein
MAERLPAVVVGTVVLSVTAGQEVVQDEISDVTTEPMTARQVLRKCTPAKMRLCVASSAAVEKLANERLDPGEHFRRDGEVKTVSLEDRHQHLGGRGADHGVSAWIRWIRRRIAHLGQPVGIGRRVGIVVRASRANRSHRAPAVVRL